LHIRRERRSESVTTRSKIWLGVALSIIALQGVVAYGVSRTAIYHLPFHVTIHGAYFKTAFADLSQFFVGGFIAVVAVGNAIRSRGAARVFWLLMSIGFLLWFADLGLWAYYEVIAQTGVPHLTFGDTLLFLHLVPIVAALGARPEQPTDPVGRHRTWLDFAVLLTYWLYFYALMVMPYEYVNPDLPTYNFNFDLVDKVGHWTLMIALAVAFVRSRGPWRRVYLLFTLASLSYAVFSDIANLAIDQDKYYSGSPYDILLVSTMCSFAYAVLEGRWLSQNASDDRLPEPASRKGALQWPAVMGMVATVSTPAIGFVLLKYSPTMSPSVREFRLAITLVAMGLLVFFVFLKQTLLQRDLVHSLASVSDAFSDLKRVKNQLVQSEKLASMGRLLAGAAHEINNPLTAILGYSDLIATINSIDPQARSMADKIGHQARRTKMLVEDLLKFSQETPTQRSPNDVQVLLDNAIKIAGLEPGSSVKIEVSSGDNLPMVAVDSAQILQVFVHLIRNAADAMRDSAVRVLHITTRGGSTQVQIEFADSGGGVREPDLVFDPFYTTKSPGKGTGLGLSACYGIIQKHGGQISCHNRAQGGAIFTITLPAAAQPEVQNA
jgi:signal transduction histidine kinase